jgi:hypothetical protein
LKRLGTPWRQRDDRPSRHSYHILLNAACRGFSSADLARYPRSLGGEKAVYTEEWSHRQSMEERKDPPPPNCAGSSSLASTTFIGAETDRAATGAPFAAPRWIGTTRPIDDFKSKRCCRCCYVITLSMSSVTPQAQFTDGEASDMIMAGYIPMLHSTKHGGLPSRLFNLLAHLSSPRRTFVWGCQYDNGNDVRLIAWMLYTYVTSRRIIH